MKRFSYKTIPTLLSRLSFTRDYHQSTRQSERIEMIITIKTQRYGEGGHNRYGAGEKSF